MNAKSQKLRIGLTMRITEANHYKEVRDSVAHDWHVYVGRVLPKADFIFLPNIGESIREYAAHLGLNALILTGGNDIGEYPIRDLTERSLIEWGKSEEVPILAICRGMQLVVTHFGGSIHKLSTANRSKHVATHHPIELNSSLMVVNSFHNFIIRAEHVPRRFEVLATAMEDHTIEAIKGENILAVMWHPERHGASDNKWEDRLIKKHFEHE